MIINIDIQSNQVESVDGIQTPFTYQVELANGFILSKQIEYVDGQIQKEINNQKIYKNPIITTTETEVKIGEEETSESEGNKPIFIQTQKVNDDKPLFYTQDGNETIDSTYEIHIPYEPVIIGEIQKTQKIYDEAGVLISELPLFHVQQGFRFFETTESEKIEIIQLQPIMISAPSGLYLKDVFETKTIIEESFEEVTTPKVAIAWESKEVPNIINVEEEIDGFDELGEAIKIKTGNYIQIQDGVKTIEIETVWQDLKPVLVDNILTRNVNIISEPKYFNADDISIDAIKEFKTHQLNNMCNKAITGTFVSSALGTPHFYSYDKEAQSNLQLTKLVIDDYPDGMTVNWRISDTREIIPHDKTQFKILFGDSIVHLQTQLYKFRQLEKTVSAMETKEEVNGISW